MIIDIDVVDLCKKLIKKWKYILLLLMLGMALGGVLTYMKEVKRVASNNEKISGGSEGVIKEKREKLSLEQIENIDYLYEMYLISLDAKRDLKNTVSISSQKKNNNYFRTLYYYNNYAPSLVGKLKDIICTKDVCKEIEEKMHKSIELQDLIDSVDIMGEVDYTKLANLDSDISGTFELVIYGDDEDYLSYAQDILNKHILDLYHSIDEKDSNIQVLAEYKNDVVEIDYSSRIIEVSKSIITFEDNLKSEYDKLQNEEKDYYNALINQNEKIEKTVVSKSRIIKYSVFIGAFLVIVYMGIYSLIYVLSGKLHNSFLLKEKYGINIICKTQSEDIETCLGELDYLYLKTNGKIGIVSSVTNDKMEKLLEMISKKYEDCRFILLKPYAVTEKDFDDMASVERIVIFEQEEVSTIKKLSQMVTYYKDRNIDIVGAVMVE